MTIFQTFWPTAVKWVPTAWRDSYKIITDNATGAPVGLVSQNANGPQGVWSPVPLSQLQIDAPTAEILADLNATYQLVEAPYSRYYSDGSQLLPASMGGDVVVPPGYNQIFESPLTITSGHDLIVQGSARIQTFV